MIQRTPERGDITDAMAILGIRKARTIEAMAARGELPGAAKIGRRWTFNLAALRAYVEEQERRVLWQGKGAGRRPAAIGVRVSFGVARSSWPGASMVAAHG